MILLLHTSCYGLCTAPDTAAISDSKAVPEPLPSCHGTPATGEGQEPQPVHNHERCEDCLYLQVGSHTASLNILNSNLVSLPVDIPVIKFQDDHRASMPDPICTEFSGSPPCRHILRI